MTFPGYKSKSKNSKTNVSAFIETLTEDDIENIEDFGLSDFRLEDHLPGAKLLAEYANTDGCGEDCEAKYVSLYRYREHIVFFHFETSGDYTETFSIKANYRSVPNFIRECVSFIHRKEFDPEIFLRTKAPQDIGFLKQFHKNYFGEEGQKRFLSYMKELYLSA